MRYFGVIDVTLWSFRVVMILGLGLYCYREMELGSCRSSTECILWRQQWTATAGEQRPDTATRAALSSRYTFVKVLTILGTPPVTT